MLKKSALEQSNRRILKEVKQMEPISLQQALTLTYRTVQLLQRDFELTAMAMPRSKEILNQQAVPLAAGRLGPIL
jgi:predicted transcriptional regulator